MPGSVSPRCEREITEDDVRWVLRRARFMKRRMWFADVDDLFGDGLEGFVQASERWDRAGSLRGFAMQRVDGAMIDGLRRNEGFRRSGDRVSVAPVDPAALTLLNIETECSDDAGVWHGDILLDAATISGLLGLLTAGEQAAVSGCVLEGRTEFDVAEEWGVSESRIAQLKKTGLERMRRALDV